MLELIYSLASTSQLRRDIVVSRVRLSFYGSLVRIYYELSEKSTSSNLVCPSV
jgi:hypothetical protein